MKDVTAKQAALRTGGVLEVARQRPDLWLTSVEIAPEGGWLHADPEFRRLGFDLGLPAVHGSYAFCTLIRRIHMLD